MTKESEALKLALEALEELTTDFRSMTDIERGEQAITAIKAALAQPEEEPTDIGALVQGMAVSVDVSTGDHDARRRLFGTVTLVQESQKDKHGLILLVQDPQPNFKAQQEPVETYIHEFTKLPHPNDFGIPKGHWWQAKQYADALYTAPPQPSRAEAFKEIAKKIKEMPWENDTKDSFLVWLKEQT